MSANLHETYDDHDAGPPPSSRSTGFVFAGVAAIIGLIWRDNPAVLAIALTSVTGLAAVSWLRPQWLDRPTYWWFRLSLLMARVMNPIVLGIIFYGVFVPFGLVMRLRADPLRSKAKGATSYWLDRDVQVGQAGQAAASQNGAVATGTSSMSNPF